MKLIKVNSINVWDANESLVGDNSTEPHLDHETIKDS